MKQETKDKIGKANMGRRKKKPVPIPECCQCTCSSDCLHNKGVLGTLIKCSCNLHKIKHKLTRKYDNARKFRKK